MTRTLLPNSEQQLYLGGNLGQQTVQGFNIRYEPRLIKARKLTFRVWEHAKYVPNLAVQSNIINDDRFL